MKILELTNYSAGGCGVFARVKREASLLKKRGHEVRIFSSNLIKGEKGIAKEEDSFEGVQIRRFPAMKLGGESFIKWNFENEAIKFNPDVIIAHSYRHMHTLKALKVARRIGAKVYLVTHAPFDRSNSRTIAGKFAVWVYDLFVGRKSLAKFNKILAITYWELPFLHELGVKDYMIEYVPNGITEDFFKNSKKTEKEEILYVGRISPIKNIELIIKALRNVMNKKIILRIFGPCENDYLEELRSIVKKEGVENRVSFVNKTFVQNEQIDELDSAKIFVLPSKSEGMPQVLIEAMARGKIVIGSDNKGNSDIIEDGKNGFLFENCSSEDLAEKINYVLSMDKKSIDKIKKNAKRDVEQFSWNKLVTKLEKIISKG